MPAGLPLTWDVKTIRGGLNFTLTTELGDLNLFGELAGGETYTDCYPIPSTSMLSVFASNVLICPH
jgi:hypothetical protein